MLRAMFVTCTLGYGGAERHSITLMNRLAKRGHECHAVYVKNDPSQLERIVLPYGSTVRCLDAARYLDWSAVANFAAHLSRASPTVIVAANDYALMYASLAKLYARWRGPLVATFHTTQLLGAKQHAKMLWQRPFFWAANRTVFVCENQKRHWLRRGLGSRKNLVIHNGVDTAHFHDDFGVEGRGEMRHARGLADTDYVIGISAALRREKNHVQLVEAIAALRATGMPARLLVIGDGPMRPTIEARARALGVMDHIEITGFQQDVRPLVALCDVMVLCSTAIETFSLAALEAMAMGKPVVHADLGGAAEMIVPERNGFLFPVGDTGALVARLACLSDRGLARRMGTAARELVETRFSESAMVDRYERILLDVCKDHSGRPSPTVRHPKRIDCRTGD